MKKLFTLLVLATAGTLCVVAQDIVNIRFDSSTENTDYQEFTSDDDSTLVLRLGSDWNTIKSNSITADETWSGTAYTHYLAGSANPTLDKTTGVATAGSYFTVTTKSAGYVEVAVIVNSAKALYIADSINGGIITDLTAYDASTDAAAVYGSDYMFYTTDGTALKIYGAVRFHVDAAGTYSVAASGSKVSVYGASFAPDPTRTILSTGYASFSSSQALIKPNGVTVYIAAMADDDSYVSLTEYEADTIPANMGMIIGGTASEEYSFNIVEDTSGVYTEPSDNEMIATSVEDNRTISESGKYYGLSTEDGLFHPINAGTMPEFRAYIAKKSDSSSASISMIIDDGSESNGTTGIGSVQTQAQSAEPVYYNLQGMRVSNPTQGLYIVNGKKVIIK